MGDTLRTTEAGKEVKQDDPKSVNKVREPSVESPAPEGKGVKEGLESGETESKDRKEKPGSGAEEPSGCAPKSRVKSKKSAERSKKRPKRPSKKTKKAKPVKEEAFEAEEVVDKSVKRLEEKSEKKEEKREGFEAKGARKEKAGPKAEKLEAKGKTKVEKSAKMPKHHIKVDMGEIKREVARELGGAEGGIEQRAPLKRLVDSAKLTEKKLNGYVKTGIEGFDALFEKGIPKGSTILIAGGAGSGKTILCLQTAYYHASRGEKCIYMSFEESEKNLIKHMEQFGWNATKLIKEKKLMIKRFNPFEITRSVDALLMKAKGELLIELEPIIFPKDFKPEYIVVDSLTAIASAFTGKEDSYRIYIEQLFRFFEKIDATTFLITETKQVPTVFSTSGVEEFLADGVVVLYNIKRGNVRERAIEVLKLRGGAHLKRIVAFQVTSRGLVVYPEQEVFGEIKLEE